MGEKLNFKFQINNGMLVSSKGSTQIGHIFVKRGRAIPLFQKDGNYVAKETKRLLNKNEKDWRN